MPSLTINVNGENYTVGYDGTFDSPQGLLPALNNLGFGLFWIEQIGGVNVLTTVDDNDIYGNATTNADPTTTTTSTTSTTTTAAPTTSTTTTTTTICAPYINNIVISNGSYTDANGTYTRDNPSGAFSLIAGSGSIFFGGDAWYIFNTAIGNVARNTSTLGTGTWEPWAPGNSTGITAVYSSLICPTTTTSTTTTTTTLKPCACVEVVITSAGGELSYLECETQTPAVTVYLVAGTYNQCVDKFGGVIQAEITTGTGTITQVGNCLTQTCPPPTTTTSTTTTTTTLKPCACVEVVITSAGGELSYLECETQTPAVTVYLVAGTYNQCVDKFGGVIQAEITTGTGTITQVGNCLTQTCPPTTTTSTTTTTTTLFAQTVSYANNLTDACFNPTGTQNVTGNTTSFCTCTVFNSAGFVTLANGNYVLAYSGNTININISGFPTTTATVTGAGCTACPLTTTTSTTTTTTTLFAQTVNYASNATDACLNPTGTQNVTGNSGDFCLCTVFNSAGFVTLANGNYVLAYSGNTVNINIAGAPTTTATVTSVGCTACPLSTTTTSTTTTLQQVWYAMDICYVGGTANSTNYDIGYAVVGDRVFGTVSGTPRTLTVSAVLTSNPGGTQIGIVNSGFTGCPATTSTTTTTTTLPPLTYDLSATCTSTTTQDITINNFAGGDGTSYYANTVTYADAVAAAAGATTLIIGGTRTFTSQVVGTRYVYAYSASRSLVKNGGNSCATTTTSTTTTTTTLQQVWYAMDICYVGGTANSTNYDIGYAVVGDRVFGTVSGTPRTLTVSAVLTSNPGGTQIGITNSGLTGCPATTTTTTTTTTIAPVTANISSVCTGITQTITIDTFGGGSGTYFASTTTYGDPGSAVAGAVSSVSGSRSYPSQPNGTRYVYVTSTAGAPVVKSGGQTCTTTSTTTTTTTLPITSTTTTSTTSTTTTLPPLVITNGGVTCSGTTGSFRASFSGGTGNYAFVAIADSPANAATCVAGGACGTGGFRVTLGGGATFYDFSGITNQLWYTAVRDSLPQTSVQNTAVSINCTTTTTSSTTTSTTPPPCTSWTVSNFNGFGLGDTVNYIDCSGTSQSTFIGDGNQFDICVLDSGTPAPYMDFGYGSVTSNGVPCP